MSITINITRQLRTIWSLLITAIWLFLMSILFPVLANSLYAQNALTLEEVLDIAEHKSVFRYQAVADNEIAQSRFKFFKTSFSPAVSLDLLAPDFVKSSMKRYCEDVLLPKMLDIYPDAFIQTDIIGEVMDLMPTDKNEALRIVSELTGANSADVVPFGTEAGIFQSIGMDVVVCGPGSIDQAHKANEFIEIDQLSQCLKMLDKLGHKLTS